MRGYILIDHQDILAQYSFGLQCRSLRSKIVWKEFASGRYMFCMHAAAKRIWLFSAHSRVYPGKFLLFLETKELEFLGGQMRAIMAQGPMWKCPGVPVPAVGTARPCGEIDSGQTRRAAAATGGTQHPFRHLRRCAGMLIGSRLSSIVRWFGVRDVSDGGMSGVSGATGHS